MYKNVSNGDFIDDENDFDENVEDYSRSVEDAMQVTFINFYYSQEPITIAWMIAILVRK